MPTSKKTNRCIVFTAAIFAIFVTLTNPRSDSQKLFVSLSSSNRDRSFDFPSAIFSASNQDSLSENERRIALQYDFYRSSCPEAERIVRSKMAEFYSQQKDVSPALLRLFFHDCFVHGCDASILLDQSVDNSSSSVEKQAVPNRTLKGFDKIDIIKEELERVCPGTVSCADIISLATRDGVVLAGGPFYPVFTGRRDSDRSYHDEAFAQIPTPEDHLPRILNLFELKGFNERETVSLLGAHNIGQMSCEFISSRLYDFNGTGQPDPTIPLDFLDEMRLNCRESNAVPAGNGPLVHINSRGLDENSELEESSFVPSGAEFDSHYYQNLLSGKGLLFSDQQLMSGLKTERLVRAYASDDGSTFRLDFARVMMKMSNLDVLTGTRGQVRLNCSLPLILPGD